MDETEDFEDFDELEPTYDVFKGRRPSFRLLLPLIVLVVVVGLISGLVFGGVLQGKHPRQAGGASTTQATVQIAP